MKCIDPWLLNNRRQCPVCKRYVFPNQDNSDEEESHTQAATERTPLIQPSQDEPVAALSRNCQAGKFVLPIDAFLAFHRSRHVLIFRTSNDQSIGYRCF